MLLNKNNIVIVISTLPYLDKTAQNPYIINKDLEEI